MTSTHDLLVDVAEELVRSEGLAALTTRALAARANYGKSTVHEAIGGTDQLVKDLRRRASRDMLAAALGETQPDPADDTWRDGMYSRLSTWIIANPHWAEVCFTATGAEEHTQWTHPLAEVFMGLLPAGVADLDPDESGEISRLAARTLGGVVPTVIKVGDVAYGALTLRDAYRSIYSALVRLVELRGLDTGPMPR